MNKWGLVFLCVLRILESNGREPMKPPEGLIPYVVYFASRYRGLCVGSMVSRTAVLTAAVCVTNPIAITDTRPINVVLGAHYRHARRGIRVQVIKIILPNLTNITENRGFLMEKSAAILILKRKIPDVLTEYPVRAVQIDWRGEEVLTLQDQCYMVGWHFHYQGDPIYPVNKFLLQRNLRVQLLNIVKKSLYCDTLVIKFMQALSNFGFHGLVDHGSVICVRDPEKTAQPCHGMYGAPLVCHGKVVGLMLSPDAQWSNCTGFTNLIHRVSSTWLQPFMACVSRLFEVDMAFVKSWAHVKKALYEEVSAEKYDYINDMYAHLYSHSESED